MQIVPGFFPRASAAEESAAVDYALNLNGTNTVAESAASRVIDSSAFTVEAWFFSAAGNSTGTRTVFSQYVSASSRLYVLLDGNELIYSYGGDTRTIIPRARYALPHGRWVHLALTRSSTASSGVAILYADGIEISRTSGTSTSNPNAIFRVGNATSSFAGGQVDQVKIWDRVLDASQIGQSMHAYSDTWNGATQDGLVAHYDFNEGSGLTIYDRKGSKNLTVSHATTFSHLATETTFGNDKIVTFPRTYLPNVGGWTVPDGVTAVRSLVVAGGGGGGSDEGGGGGAGGMIETSSQSVSGVESVVVGQGGLGGYSTSSTALARRATSGQDSYFGTTSKVITIGGGAGGDSTNAAGSVRDGLSGGSGGGGAGENVASSGGSGSSPQGNNGASRTSTVIPGGGGGGAGAAATDRAGGEGLQSTITGVTPAPYYAAGGSGGCGNDCSPTQASTNSIGGAGGGTSGDGTLGVANTGSGGGGGRFSGTSDSAAGGGSGVVIIRYTYQYTVTYNYNGGSGSPVSDLFTVGGTAITLPVPTKTGFSFAGWFEDAGFSGSAVTSSYEPASSLTLFARWTADTYTVTYDTQGGSVVNAGSWTYDTSLTLPAAPTRAGYTFAGWSTNSNASTLVYETTNPVRSNNAIVYTSGYGRGANDAATTLTNQGATFNRVRYRMEASYNGTLRYADVSFDKWQGATIADLAVPDLASGNDRTIKQNVSNLSVDSNWVAVSGVASGVTNGTGKLGRVELWPWDYGTATTGIVPAGNGSVYDNDDTTVSGGVRYGSFQVHNLTDNQTVLAWNRHYEANPDIGFGNYLGSVNTDWTFARNTNFSIPTWKLQIYIDNVYPSGASFAPTNTSGFTMYAQWTVNSLAVTYDSQLGSSISNGTTVTDGSIASSPGTPTRAGYTFDGWFTAQSGGTAVSFPYEHGRTSDFTLYAQWTANPLVVTYDSRGGSVISNGATVSGGSIASSPGTPTRSGFDFKGWYVTSTGGSAISFPYSHGRTSNFTLYAQWISNQSGFVITGNPATLAYQDTVDLGHFGGNGTGAVSFSTTTGSVCSVASVTGIVTMLTGTGQCTIVATKAADADYYATTATIDIAATKVNQSSFTISGTATGTYGATVSLSTIGGSTGGTITWAHNLSTACTVNSSGVVTITSGTSGIGACTIFATMAGNSDYFAITSSSFTITVSKAQQAVVNVSSTSAMFGQNLTLVTTGGSGSGQVTWDRISGACTLSGATLTPTAATSCVVRATRAGDSNYLERASSDVTVTIARGNQTGFSVTSGSILTTGSTLSLTAAGGQTTGAISWQVLSGICTVSGSQLSAIRGGVSCTVEATKAGDSNYLAASDTVVITVNKIVQTLTFRSTPPNQAEVGDTYTVAVDSDAFLAATVTVTNQSTSVCNISVGIVTFNSPGTCVVSATQAGNDVYTAAAVSQSITVGTSTQATTTTIASSSSAAVAESTTTTTLVQSSAGVVASQTPTTTSTTTTTTTTVPADPTQPQPGADGQTPNLEAGQTTALVRGREVAVRVQRIDDRLVLTLPNQVTVKFALRAPGSESATISADGVLRVYRRDIVDMEMTGLIPGTIYTVFMFSEPVELGRGIANIDGEAVMSMTIPSDVNFGDHTIQVNGVGPDGEMVSLSVGFEVLERTSNTWVVVLSLSTAVLLALLGGRPIFRRRRERRRLV